MAVNIVRGVYGLAFAGGLYLGIKDGIVAPSLTHQVNIIQKDPDEKEGYYEYANRIAGELGVKKEIIVIRGYRCSPYGNNLFSLRAGIRIRQSQSIPGNVTRHMIIHEIAHVRSSDILIWTLIPMIISLFTTFILNSRFSALSCAAGLTTGAISHALLHRWREKQAILTAIKYSTKDMNVAYLEWLETEAKSNTFKKNSLFFLSLLYKPSHQELISIYRKQLQ